MLFLVRNWYDPELEFGFRGGAEYLAEEMDQLPSRGALATACQQPPRCFLMPHPGDVVASDRYDGNINGRRLFKILD
jgi:hypothetical protein